MTNDNTRIEWTDATWNPTTGCSKVSAGCVNCYAEAVSHRWGHTTKPWTHPHAAENVVLHPERLDQPLRWRRPRRIFVDSMSDLFHEHVPDEYIDQVFGVMARAPQHTFQLLTKRPDRMRRYIDRGPHLVDVRNPIDAFAFTPDEWPLPNVWLGTSVEDQRVAHRIGDLVFTPAAVRFLSCEPLIGSLDLSPWMATYDDHGEFVSSRSPLDWVIVGGESGPNHRPLDLGWVRTLRDQCTAARVSFFFKQVGGRTPKAGGRELDGRTWDEFPSAGGIA